MPLASLVVPAKIILRGSDVAASSWLADLSLRVLAVKSALARQNTPLIWRREVPAITKGPLSLCELLCWCTRSLPVDRDVPLLSTGDDGRRECNLGCSPPRPSSPSYKFSLFVVSDFPRLLGSKMARPSHRYATTATTPRGKGNMG